MNFKFGNVFLIELLGSALHSNIKFCTIYLSRYAISSIFYYVSESQHICWLSIMVIRKINLSCCAINNCSANQVNVPGTKWASWSNHIFEYMELKPKQNTYFNQSIYNFFYFQLNFNSTNMHFISAIKIFQIIVHTK